jgi:hypothetical protein
MRKHVQDDRTRRCGRVRSSPTGSEHRRSPIYPEPDVLRNKQIRPPLERATGQAWIHAYLFSVVYDTVGTDQHENSSPRPSICRRPRRLFD